MANENIGELGRAFLAQRTELGIDFDEAWAEWELVSRALHFILIDCPDVRNYDGRGTVDRDERLRIRCLAREKIGSHIRSADVSALGKAAGLLGVRKPLRPYRLDRDTLRDFYSEVAERWEAREGWTEELAGFRAAISDERRIDVDVQTIKRFAEEHSLWAVPPGRVITLFCNHLISQMAPNHSDTIPR